MEPQWESNIYQEFIQYDLVTSEYYMNEYYIKFDNLWELSPQLYRKSLGGNMGIHNYVQSEVNG
jgi:hypothetical protein